MLILKYASSVMSMRLIKKDMAKMKYALCCYIMLTYTHTGK